MDKKRIELLAPAKNLAQGKTAIDYGADAVYIGAPQYSARSRAGNSIADIEQLAAYAHTWYANVYVALNTLLTDKELDDAVKHVHQLYNAGIDGLIIQDVGLLERNLPPIPIIASTQMHNNTAAKAAFLEQIGFKRIILARELGLKDIKAIRQKSEIELEYFVHGALCVSYSGQCYLSYTAGGRSGNRGECAQPCRKRYSLQDEDGNTIVNDRYLLSIKDLNHSQHLGDLLDAGITSFKIEGRLKDETYVKNVVTSYRRALDIELEKRDLARSSSGASFTDLQPNLNYSFNRGYTSYFIDGRPQNLGTNETPKMVGNFIGKIKNTDKQSFTLETKHDLTNGDGISFFKDNELHGTIINRVEAERVIPEKMEGLVKGIEIYRNHHHAFIKQVTSSKSERKIPIYITLFKTENGLGATFQDTDNNVITVEMDAEKVPAQKPEAMRTTLHKQMAKLGETEFIANLIETDNLEQFFFPMGVLNALRREAVERLQAERQLNRPVELRSIDKNDIPYPETSLSFTGNVLNKSARHFYHRHGVTDIESAAESGLDLSDKKVMTTKYCIREQIGICIRTKPENKYKEPFYLIDEQGHRYRLAFNCKDCEMEVYY